MRITNNQLIQGQMNAVKAASDQNKVADASSNSQKNQNAFSVGDRLSGTLMAQSGNLIQLDLKGRGIVSVQVSGQSVAMMQTFTSNDILNHSVALTIEVTENGSVLEGKILEGKMNQEVIGAASKQILSRLNLPITEQNLKAVELLNQYKLEPSSASIKALVDGSISASKLSQLPQETLKQLDVHMTLKEALVHLMKTDGLGSPSENTVKANATEPSTPTSAIPATADESGDSDNDTALKMNLPSSAPLDSKGTVTANMALLQDAVNGPLVSGQTPVLVDDAADPMDTDKKLIQEIVQENDQPKGDRELKAKEPFMKMSDMLSRTDIDKLAVLLKAGMPLTIKNAIGADQILFGNNKLSKQLLTILDAVEKTDFSEIGTEIEAFLVDSLSEESFSNEEQLKKVSQFLTELKGMPEANDLKDALGQIKNSMEFIKEVNQNLIFVQLPVKMDDTMKTVDLYMKKRKKGSENQDELKLLIALSTETTGRVQAFIDWNKERVKVNFKLENDEWVDLYNSELEALQDSLKGLSERPVFLECHIKTAESPIEAFLSEESSGQSLIDYKV